MRRALGRRRGGFTLAEVLVASLILVLISAAVMTVFVIAARQSERQKCYLDFEDICLEIDAYGDRYGREWNIMYFGNDSAEQFYNANREHISGRDGAKYALTFKYVGNAEGRDELVVSVAEIESGRKIIDGLNYGYARYEA